MNIKPKPAYLVMAFLLLVSAGDVWAAASASADPETGDWYWHFRYRLETVDQDSFSTDATASTLRARLGYASPERRGFSVHVELDYVAELFADDFNAGAGNTPGRSQYPVVADPEGEDLNQAFIQYAGAGSNQFRAGRQRIIFDNARFVGNVGWRQNEQTYDAVLFSHGSEKDALFRLAYVDNVNRIFGNDVADGDHEQRTWLANFSKVIAGGGKIGAYYYDIEDRDAPALSNATLGIRYAGSRATDNRKFGYVLEFARQSDNGGPVDFDANYFRVDLSADFGPASLYAGYESLEGDDTSAGRSFRTPLATLHAFNGWADQFLSTPSAGLADAFVGLKGKAGPWAWNMLYHDFSAQSGPGDYGSEVDMSFSRGFAERYDLLLKAAFFDAGSPSYTDTTKLWLQLEAKF